MSSTSVRTDVLNPASETVTEYMPASSAGASNAPVEFVITVVVTLVPWCFTTTVAPGTGPPLESNTTPESADLVVP
jgi:hypothetical protein